MIKFKYYLGERVDTTQNASVTELFPALAFNMNFKPRFFFGTVESKYTY